MVASNHCYVHFLGKMESMYLVNMCDVRPLVIAHVM